MSHKIELQHLKYVIKCPLDTPMHRGIISLYDFLKIAVQFEKKTEATNTQRSSQVVFTIQLNRVISQQDIFCWVETWKYKEVRIP